MPSMSDSLATHRSASRMRTFISAGMDGQSPRFTTLTDGGATDGGCHTARWAPLDAGAAADPDRAACTVPHAGHLTMPAGLSNRNDAEHFLHVMAT